MNNNRQHSFPRLDPDARETVDYGNEDNWSDDFGESDFAVSNARRREQMSLDDPLAGNVATTKTSLSPFEDDADWGYADDEEQGETLRAADISVGDLARLAAYGNARKTAGANLASSKERERSATQRVASSCITKLRRVGRGAWPAGYALDHRSSFAGEGGNDHFEHDWALDIDFPDKMAGLSISREKLALNASSAQQYNAPDKSFNRSSRDRAGSEAFSSGSISDATTDSTHSQMSHSPSKAPSQSRSDKRISSSASSVVSGTAASSSSRAKGGPLIVGEMLFDSVNLRWVRHDGQEDDDPFAAVEYEESRGGATTFADLDSAATNDFEDWSNRFSTVRKVHSAAPIARARDSVHTFSGEQHLFSCAQRSGPSREMNHIDCSVAHTSMSQLVNDAVGDKEQSVPLSLSNRIPKELWQASISARTRHNHELAGFLPTAMPVLEMTQEPLASPRISGRISSLPRARNHVRQEQGGSRETAHSTQVPLPGVSEATASKRRHLYLLRIMARREAENAS